jgi:sialate O-acetylesterase
MPPLFPSNLFPHTMKRLVLASAGALLFLQSARANVTVSEMFQDHAVLQAGKPLTVWGEAAPREDITVAFAGQSMRTTAASDGTWRVTLAPLAVNRNAAVLTVQGQNTVTVSDVLVGEVWLCSGQSNMQFTLSQASQADAEIAVANLPEIRQFQVHEKAANSVERHVAGTWKVCTRANAGGFTAVGYFFARELSQHLDVPVGLINSTWGGTDIEAWLTPAAIAANPALTFIGPNWQKQLDAYPAAKAAYDQQEAAEEAKAAEARARGETYTKHWNNPVPNPDGSPHRNKPSNLYNGMIAPLQQVALAGVLWYQGENNTARPGEYRLLFPALITGWRNFFAESDLPFYWVQLPNFHGNPHTEDWVALREAQAAALALPATGQAITIDVGEFDNIHPKNKLDVGHRLALLALHRHYGVPLVDSGPQFDHVVFKDAEATVFFRELGGGLIVHGLTTLNGFEVAGMDRVFQPAEARVVGDTVRVHAAKVAAPVAVRYAWHNGATAGLFNHAGLPAAPFRSDAW